LSFPATAAAAAGAAASFLASPRREIAQSPETLAREPAVRSALFPSPVFPPLSVPFAPALLLIFFQDALPKWDRADGTRSSSSVWTTYRAGTPYPLVLLSRTRREEVQLFLPLVASSRNSSGITRRARAGQGEEGRRGDGRESRLYLNVGSSRSRDAIEVDESRGRHSATGIHQRKVPSGRNSFRMNPEGIFSRLRLSHRSISSHARDK